MEKKRQTSRSYLQPGKILQFKSKVRVPSVLKSQGIGPFRVLRKEGPTLFLIGGSSAFQVSVVMAVKLFEPCQLRIC